MRIREECEVMKTKILNPVAVIDTIEEEMDIDIEDPEVDSAATKTQNSFNGQNEMKKENLNKIVTLKEEVAIDQKDPEVDKAKKDQHKKKKEKMNKVEFGSYHHNIKVIKIDTMKEEIDIGLENADVDKAATIKKKRELTDKDRDDDSHITKWRNWIL